MSDQPIKASSTQVQVLEWQKLALLAVVLFAIMLIGRLGRSNNAVHDVDVQSPVEIMAQSAGI